MMAEFEKSAKAWVEMLAALPNIHATEKADVPTKTGGRYSYAYANLPGILEVVKPVMAKHGFIATQDVTMSDRGDPAVVTIIDHDSGEQRRYGPLVIPGGGGAQTIGSAITYARRYALVAALGLAPDEDDDGRAAQESSTKEAAKDPVSPQAHYENAAKEEVFRLVGNDIEEAATAWPLVLEKAGVAEVQSRAARDKVIAAARDMFAVESDGGDDAK
jgi:hypothetical protein